MGDFEKVQKALIKIGLNIVNRLIIRRYLKIRRRVGEKY